MTPDIAAYKRDGFLILKRFFEPSRIEAIRREAREIFFRQIRAKGFTDREFAAVGEQEFNELLYRLFDEDVACLANCGKQVQHMISLHRLALDPAITDLLRGLGLGHPNVSTRPVLFFNHPRLAQKKVFHTVDAHQDWRSMQGSLNAVVIWVPLVDVDRALGALEVVPGSHRRGLQTDHLDGGFGMVALDDAAQRNLVSVELAQGDVLAFSSFLIHQSGNNVTDAPRWSCHFRYNDLAEPTFVRRGYPHAYVYKPVEELLTPGFPTAAEVERVFE